MEQFWKFAMRKWSTSKGDHKQLWHALFNQQILFGVCQLILQEKTGVTHGSLVRSAKQMFQNEPNWNVPRAKSMPAIWNHQPVAVAAKVIVSGAAATAVRLAVTAVAAVIARLPVIPAPVAILMDRAIPSLVKPQVVSLAWYQSFCPSWTVTCKS